VPVPVEPSSTPTPGPSAVLSVVPNPPTLPRGDRTKCAVHYSNPLALWDVYVDDFLGLVQGGNRTLRRVKWALRHTLDTVLRPLDDADSDHRQEPASLKKMAKGESAWSTVKVILGWVIDTVANTTSLPAHRITRVLDILASIGPTQCRVSLKKWKQVLGEIRSMALAIPEAIDLFSILQEEGQWWTPSAPHMPHPRFHAGLSLACG
jgi:hypothetical protein